MLLWGDVEHLVEGIVPDLTREGARPSAPCGPNPGPYHCPPRRRPAGQAARTAGKPHREVMSRGARLLALQSNISEMGPLALVKPSDAAAPANTCLQPHENQARSTQLSCLGFLTLRNCGDNACLPLFEGAVFGDVLLPKKE